MLYQVHAFTDTALKGNPAGVMIVDEAMTDERMQNIAADFSMRIPGMRLE